MLASASIGALAAVAASAWLVDEDPVRNRPVSEPVPAHTASAQPLPLTLVERSASNDARYAAMEAQLSGLTRQLAALGDTIDTQLVPPSPARESEDDPAYFDMTEEEMLAEEVENHAHVVHGHYAEAVDPQWSPGAQTRFLNDFERLSDVLSRDDPAAGFGVHGLSCRATSCVVTLRWDSYESASNNAEVFAYHDFAESCAMSVLPFPPEAEDPAGDYMHDVIFDCSQTTAS